MYLYTDHYTYSFYSNHFTPNKISVNIQNREFNLKNFLFNNLKDFEYTRLNLFW